MSKGFIKRLSLISSNLKSHRIGDLLVNSGVITQEQLISALNEQRTSNKKLGSILLKQGSVSFLQFYHKLALQYVYKVFAVALSSIVVLTSPSISYANYLGQEFQISTSNLSDSEQAHNYPKLFGTDEIMSHDIGAFTKWTSTIDRYNRQIKTTDESNPILKDWKTMIEDSKNLSAKAKIKAVNDFINNVKYIEDIDNYGKSDYWATPIEFLSKGGDCEDYAIAKYASLRALGFKDSQLRITIVTDQIKNLSHAILVVYTDNGESLILDNQNKKVKNTSSISYYKPIFSINREAWWEHKA